MTDRSTQHSEDVSDDGMERRDLLKGATALGLGSLGLSTGSAAAHPKPHTISLRAVEVPIQYEIVVSGEIAMGEAAGETDRIVDSNIARGFISNVGELDSYRFSGQITEFNVSVADALKVFVNGRQVEDPVGLPKGKPAKPKLPNRIRIQALGEEVPYVFTVGGRVQKLPKADTGDRIVDGNTVKGAVGDGGVDNFRFSGPISFDSGDGPLKVTLRLQ